MRGIIPPDIASTDLSVMLRQGLPPVVAKRVWTCGALWLICMHTDDIAKVRTNLFHYSVVALHFKKIVVH